MPELLRFKSWEGFKNNLPRAFAMYFTSHRRNVAKITGGAKWILCIRNLIESHYKVAEDWFELLLSSYLTPNSFICPSSNQ